MAGTQRPRRGRRGSPQSGHERLVHRKKSATIHFFSGSLSNRSRHPDHLSTGLQRTKTSPARRKGVKKMRICGWRGPRGVAEACVGRPSQVTNFWCSEKKVPPSTFVSGPLSNRSRPPDHLSKGLHRTRTSLARRKGVKNMRISGWLGPRGVAEACVGHPSQVTNFWCSEKKLPPSTFFPGLLSNRSRPPDHLIKGLHRTKTSPVRSKGVENMRI